jgi:hypothetical protein
LLFPNADRHQILFPRVFLSCRLLPHHGFIAHPISQISFPDIILCLFSSLCLPFKVPSLTLIFSSRSRRELFGVWVHRTDPTNKILLFLPDDVKLSTNTLVEYAKQMKNEKIQRCIVVYKDKITPFSKQYVAKAQQFYDFELFKDSELLVNITKHHLVPKHDLLTQDEKKELLDK